MRLRSSSERESGRQQGEAQESLFGSTLLSTDGSAGAMWAGSKTKGQPARSYGTCDTRKRCCQRLDQDLKTKSGGSPCGRSAADDLIARGSAQRLAKFGTWDDFCSAKRLRCKSLRCSGILIGHWYAAAKRGDEGRDRGSSRLQRWGQRTSLHSHRVECIAGADSLARNSPTRLIRDQGVPPRGK